MRKDKHQTCIDDLAQKLSKNKKILLIEKNKLYSVGECDLLVHYKSGKKAYWEIKSNHTPKGYKKAEKQLGRWSKYWNYHRMLGVYWTPQKMEVMYVNGERK